MLIGEIAEVSIQCIYVGKKNHLLKKNLWLVNQKNKNLGSKYQSFKWKTTEEHKNASVQLLIKLRLFSC